MFPWLNPVVVQAYRDGVNYVNNKIRCKDDCEKVSKLIWIGWDCGGPNPITAIAAVEIEVRCVKAVQAITVGFPPEGEGSGGFLAPIFRKESPSGAKEVPKK